MFKKKVEKIRHKLMNRVLEVQRGEPLDFENGCLWCYRPRMPESQFCCEDHKNKFEFHNGGKTIDV